jgi:hypothetical protein
MFFDVFTLTTSVRRSPLAVHGLMTHFDPAVTTLYDMMQDTVAKHAEQPFLGVRLYNPDGTRGAYKWLSYKEVSATSVMRSALALDVLFFHFLTLSCCLSASYARSVMCMRC